MAHVQTLKATNTQTQNECFAVRHQVFVNEQGIDATIERDEYDANPSTWHLLAKLENQPAGAVRVTFPETGKAKIGRLAVLSTMRGHGIARHLMEQILTDLAAQKTPKVVLSAQAYLEEFYHGLGFKTVGERYEEVGIPHVFMEKKI